MCDPQDGVKQSSLPFLGSTGKDGTQLACGTGSGHVVFGSLVARALARDWLLSLGKCLCSQGKKLHVAEHGRKLG